MEALNDLINKLERIAVRNKDKFRYRIEIDISTSKKISFHFISEETADNHCFVDGVGETIEKAVEDAAGSIKDVCESWGYKNI
jgi:hypothetical protein